MFKGFHQVAQGLLIDLTQFRQFLCLPENLRRLNRTCVGMDRLGVMSQVNAERILGQRQPGVAIARRHETVGQRPFPASPDQEW